MAARIGNRMICQSRQMESGLARTSIEAEAFGVRLAISAAMDAMPEATGVRLFSDCKAVVDALSGFCSARAMRRPIAEIDDLVSRHQIAFEISWVKGHSGGTRLRTANTMAHNLAYFGRNGEELSYETAFSLDWRGLVSDRDPRLLQERLTSVLSLQEAAETLRLPEKTVFTLAVHGHLESVGYDVTRRSVERVRRYISSMRQSFEPSQEAEMLPTA